MATGFDNLDGTTSFNASFRLIKPITFGPTTASGTSTASGATSLTDGGASWGVNAFAGLTVYSNGSSAVVVSNTSTVITVASWTGGTPTAVKPYQIAAAGINGPMGNPVTLGTISSSGIVMVRDLIIIGVTALTDVAAGATMTFGVTGQVALFTGAARSATGLTANKYWTDTQVLTAGAAVPAAMKDVAISANIIQTITIENILTGALQAIIYWDPISAGATLT